MRLLPNPEHLASIDALDSMYPSSVTVLRKTAELGSPTSTLYGYLIDGAAHLQAGDFSAHLKAGAFFAIPGRAWFGVKRGPLVIIERHGFLGQFAHGMRETRGRLSYIDGCSDSMLVYPPRRGDPVLNHLHFPPGILQTQHTHPSIRLGVVAKGRGVAWQQPTNLSNGWEHPLEPGTVFLLEEQELHSFKTEADSMDVIAYHPDSDWGPTDTLHPMIQRTYIDHGK